MVSEVSSSLTWHITEHDLHTKIRQLQTKKVSNDAKKMLRNISGQIAELCRLELEFRRHPGKVCQEKIDEHLKKINNEISTLEQWLLICVLSN